MVIKVLTILLFLCIYQTTSAQIENMLVKELDIKPKGMEGKDDPRKIIASNMKYPQTAAEQGAMGKVIVSFTINPNGTIKNIDVVNDVHPLLDEEAVRVINLTNGRWIAGEKSGQKVESYFEWPINYILEGDIDDIRPTGYFYENAKKLYNKSDFLNAIKYLEEIRKREPYDFENLMRLANSYKEIGEIYKSCMYWRRLIFVNQKIDEKTIRECEFSKIEFRFEGGEFGFRKFIAENLTYPSISIERNSIGLSVSEISITPEGEIENIQIINSIDDAIDNEVMRVIKASKHHWLKCDSIKLDQHFYIQVAFDLPLRLSFTSYNHAFSFYQIKNDLFMPSVICTSVKPEGSGFPMSDDSLAVMNDRLIKEGKYSEALEIINQLIKRNPYNKNLYQVRIFLCRKTKQNELITTDIKKMSDFAEGLSLDQLLITN